MRLLTTVSLAMWAACANSSSVLALLPASQSKATLFLTSFHTWAEPGSVAAPRSVQLGSVS